jgi:L-ascorbate metabolism protein UlaG (beta-lactamase superfamily)
VTSQPPLYAKPNLQIEGLVDKFYAWAHLLPPATSAMNLANLHLPLLDSYTQSPQVHAAAVANPKMRGGFFVDYGGARVAEIRALRDAIARDNASLLDLAEGIRQAEDLLRTQATGYDLTPLYAQLPQSVRGFVELVYDLDHHPSLRFLESLLYRSRYHREERQSIDLSLDGEVERPFVLSTPRLPGPGHLQLPLPLRHPGIDALFDLRRSPRPLGEIRDALEIEDDATAGELTHYLTPEPVTPGDRYVDSGARIRYFGHACLVMQTPDTSIIVDPFISANYSAGDRFSYVDLPDRFDFCLITHGHQDHIVLESLLQLRGRTEVLVVPRCGGGHLQDPSLRLYLEQLGFCVREVEDFDELPFRGGSIVACPFLGEHSDLDIRGKTTYWIRLGGRTVFVDADSSGIEPELYGRIHDAVGGTDLAFLGMECDGAPLTWLYGGLFTQPVSRKMSLTRKLSGSNAEQAMGIVEQLGATEAYVYAMGEESWLQHVMATSYTPESYQLKQVAVFLDECGRRGVKAEHLLVRKEFRW